jgi:hypothetical protein
LRSQRLPPATGPRPRVVKGSGRAVRSSEKHDTSQRAPHHEWFRAKLELIHALPRGNFKRGVEQYRKLQTRRLEAKRHARFCRIPRKRGVALGSSCVHGIRRRHLQQSRARSTVKRNATASLDTPDRSGVADEQIPCKLHAIARNRRVQYEELFYRSGCRRGNQVGTRSRIRSRVDYTSVDEFAHGGGDIVQHDSNRCRRLRSFHFPWAVGEHRNPPSRGSKRGVAIAPKAVARGPWLESVRQARIMHSK